MTIIAHSHAFIIGIDTHAKNHVFALIDANTGESVDARSFPSTSRGYHHAIDWAGKRTHGSQENLWVIEGAASYGARLYRALTQVGNQVVEAARMSAKDRHAQGKDDTIDAHRIAHSVRNLHPHQLRYPRLDQDARQALAILDTARTSMTKERTEHVNALGALVRKTEFGLDTRKALSKATITMIAGWRARKGEDLDIATARHEAIRLAKRIQDLDEQLAENKELITHALEHTEAAVLLKEKGIGPISAARAMIVWSHPGRVKSEAAFAAIAGVNPIPASSGNTQRHRLNRSGDRKLNAALHMIAVSRMTHDSHTRAYVEKRLAEGKTKPEIRRSLKRYIVRHIYRTLNQSSLDEL